MRYTWLFLSLLCFYSCNSRQAPRQPLSGPGALAPAGSYLELKQSVAAKRKAWASKYASGSLAQKKTYGREMTVFWVSSISTDLYSFWSGTPWDFNGTTTAPGQGNIACGYFVTTLLQDMGCKINRRKLAVCASLEMMRSLCPGQKVRNLSRLSYETFTDTLQRMGIGVYIVGLDYHTGFIVVDSQQSWFIHSNYIDRAGVMKEPVLYSAALKSSSTRWLVSLTGDADFLARWLKYK